MGNYARVGRPYKYTAEEFRIKVIEYFESVDKENQQRKLQRFMADKVKPYTLSGLCVYLGISRETWREYSKVDEYVDTIKTARTIVENYVEEGVLNGTVNPIGGIFNLKNNFGWVDKQEIEIGKAEPEDPTPELVKEYEEKLSRLKQLTGS